MKQNWVYVVECMFFDVSHEMGKAQIRFIRVLF